MIVMRLWITEKKRFNFVVVRKHWKGWFLFGGIPVFIMNYQTDYPLGFDRR